MGFLDSGKKTTQTTSNVSTVTDQSQTLGGVNVGVGDAIQAGGDVNIESTDYGAIGGAFSLGESALESNAKSVDSALDFADSIGSRSIDSIGDANDRSLDFGEHALSDSFTFGRAALDANTETAQLALAGVVKSSADTTAKLGNAIDQASAATRTDSADTLNKITKYGSIAIGVVAVAVALIFILKK